MKVDFSGAASALQKLMMGPAAESKPRTSTESNFSTLLGDLRPNLLKKPEINSSLPSSSPPTNDQTPDGGIPLARYSFESPSFSTSALSPSSVTLPTLEENGTVGVKSPTLLSVKRLSATDSSAGVEVHAPKRERVEQVEKLVQAAGEQHGIDPSLGMAVVSVESAFNPKALSSDGHFSKGLFQLLDSTAKTIIERDGLNNQYVPYESVQNVDLGVRYLRYLHELFTKETTLSNGMKVHPTANSTDLEKLAVAAFNAGEGRVAASQSAAVKAGEDPSQFADVARYLPESTQEYVLKVMKEKEQFSLSSDTE